MPDYEITTFGGLNTSVKDIKSLKPGISPDSLNWITSKFKDSIELRRGYARLGSTEVTGVGKITGLTVGLKSDGTQVPFFSYGRKAKYYNADTDDTVEIGSDMLPVAADGEDVWFEPYQNLAGSFVLFGSPNSGVYKVPTANPGNAVDQNVNSYRWGVFHIGQSRAFAGQRNGTTAGNNDKTGLYLSYIDKSLLSSYPQTTGEAFGTGDGSTKTFAYTLAVVAAPKTAMYVSVTDGVETFTDDRNGLMVGNLGGTGTVNYATGEVSVTFNTAPANPTPITCSYYTEDATSNGVLDFTGGASGQGKSFRQDSGGGNIMAIFNRETIEYCFHALKTWKFTGQLDDSASTNLPYRNVGIPYTRAAYPTPEGIIFADLSRPTEPKFRLLDVLENTNSDTIEPTPISDALDLTSYAFDTCVAFRWGDFDIFCVQEKVNQTPNGYNTIMFIRNSVSKVWDRLNYPATSLAEYLGTLIAGDSLSNNVYTLFSGWDEDGDVIQNYWTSSDLNLGTENLKNCRRMVIDGLIQPTQKVDVSISYDGGPFAKVFTIDGSGDYVDQGAETAIGGSTIGSRVIGGATETASPFTVDFPINSDRFINARIKLQATDIGYVSVSSMRFKDIRNKGRKDLPTRTT
jgi:hypothetical protein